jgi:DNA-binding NarL/FixJ family response regulator
MIAPHYLSELEIAIVQALAQGLQSKEIAAVVDRSRTTIEYHIRLLFVKMQASSRAQIVARGYEFGLLPLTATAESSQTPLHA